ncbi:MAG TPA: hypothetical protein GX714_06185 [Chloroflexi bacterium]|nr:hypothetical protein [Chloroflexota bacterium]
MAEVIRAESAIDTARVAASRLPSPLRALARPTIAVAMVLFGASLVNGFALIYDDLNLHYPFMFPDSYDWIANGLYHAGYAVRFTARAPGLPLIIAALTRADALRFLPFVNLAVMLGVLATCYRLYARAVAGPAALVAVTLLYASYFFHSFPFWVLADLYCLLFIALSLHEFLGAREAPRRYVTSALYLGVSAAFQYAGIVLLPAYGLVWFLCRRRTPAWRYLGLAAVTLAVTLAPWMLYRWVAFGDPLYSHVEQVQLVRWHLDSIPFYLFNTVGAVGIVACVIALVGLISALRRGRDETLLLMILVLAGNILFWVLLYDWNERRFVLYWLVPIYYLVAHGVRAAQTVARPGRWRWPLTTGLVVVLALYANLDVGSPLSVDRIALSPRHHLVAPTIAKDSGVSIDVRALRVERVDRGLLGSLAVSKPLAARRLPVPPPSAADVAEARRRLAERYPDGSPRLWFHYGAGRPHSWYDYRNRYGNAFLTTLERADALADVPVGEPLLMLKPHDPAAQHACEVLWDLPESTLLVMRVAPGPAEGDAP